MKRKLHYLALGDSYTFGEGVDKSESWPVIFVKQLNQLNYKVLQPKILAKTGWTTSELIEKIRKEKLKSNYDFISLSIGVNNQYRELEIKSFKNEFLKLVEIALELVENNAKRIFVLSIPDWSYTNFAKEKFSDKKDIISKEILSYNKVKQQICNKKDIKFINITSLTQKETTIEEYLAEDGLHYNTKMHQFWVAEILQNWKPKR